MRSFLIFFCCAVLILRVDVHASPLRESTDDMLIERETGNVRFYLYTQADPNTPHEVFINDVESIKQGKFEKSRHTKIVIHGWGGTYTSSPNPQMREAYFMHDDYNIICVDWYPYSKLNYISARNRVPLVGEDIGELIDFLYDEFSLDLDMLVLIGHSLGAHVAGFAGKSVTRGKVAAIVALDAAGPLYSFDNTDTRLADTDAKYVESIQTNGNTLGFLEPVGTSSFYPNWGRKQPGCGVDVSGSCSHGRSVRLYAQAIKGYTFTPVFKCDEFDTVKSQQSEGCVDFQPHVGLGDPLHIPRVEGIYYFETSDAMPYGHLEARGD